MDVYAGQTIARVYLVRGGSPPVLRCSPTERSAKRRREGADIRRFTGSIWRQRAIRLHPGQGTEARENAASPRRPDDCADLAPGMLRLSSPHVEKFRRCPELAAKRRLIWCNASNVILLVRAGVSVRAGAHAIRGDAPDIVVSALITPARDGAARAAGALLFMALLPVLILIGFEPVQPEEAARLRLPHLRAAGSRVPISIAGPSKGPVRSVGRTADAPAYSRADGLPCVPPAVANSRPVPRARHNRICRFSSSAHYAEGPRLRTENHTFASGSVIPGR